MTPPERLRASLELSRAQGEPFDTAWTAARRHALAPLRGGWADGPVVWDKALHATRSAWKRAYNRAPATDGDRSAARLLPHAEPH